MAPDPVKRLLDALYTLAVNGNTTAAKLWLEYHLRTEGMEIGAVSTEEVLRMIQENA